MDEVTYFDELKLFFDAIEFYPVFDGVKIKKHNRRALKRRWARVSDTF
jgi:hypothetical protein